MMALAPDAGDVRARWSTNFAVDDVDEAARVASSLGATVSAVQALPGIGRYADVVSPGGVEFAVVEYLEA